MGNTTPENYGVSFQERSPEMDLTFSEFIDQSLHKEIIGPGNADRLLEVLPADFLPANLHQRLAYATTRYPTHPEVIAACLRTIDDFPNTTQPLRYRSDQKKDPWQDAYVDDGLFPAARELGKISLRTSDTDSMQTLVHPHYPGIYTLRDAWALYEKTGRRAPRPARFAILLNFYTTNTAYYELTGWIARRLDITPGHKRTP